MLPTRQLCGATSTLAYLVLLRVEIARFTRTEPARLCCSDPHLAVERCYLLRCPVQSGRSSSAWFPTQQLALLPLASCTSGGLADFTPALSATVRFRRTL